ncbi:MAG: FtsX-like permease family protein [Desulfovibrio sp.]|nr:FtsX-like permease family protein [Desulfovibrio sp.]
MSTPLLSLFLALRDWLHERTLSLCAVLALASMLAPLLVLQGVRNGVLDGLRENLLKDPTVLVISPTGSGSTGSFTKEFIEELRRIPGVRFAIGRTREIATDITLENADHANVTVHMEPCAQGEPILEHFGQIQPTDGDVPELVLSSRAAARLAVTPGSTVTASIGRKNRDGRLESFTLSLRVVSVLPQSAADRVMGFIPLTLLEDIQDYRDGFAVPSRGLTGLARSEDRRYASFRLYAENLDAVPDVTKALMDRKIEVRTKAHDIANIKSLETAIDQVILILSLAVAAGFSAFAVSSVQGAVRRKVRMLGLLRLFGFSRFSLLLYPLMQTFLTSFSGSLLSLVAYWCVSLSIDHFFASQSDGNALCTLHVEDCVLALGVVFLLSSAASLHAARRAASVDPSSVIREV